MLVQGERGTKADVFGLIAIALQEHICGANSVGFRVNLLTKEMDRYILATSMGKCKKTFLSNGKHTAGSTSPIVAGVCSVLNLVRNGNENKVCHKLNNVTRRPVFTGFLVILLVETTDQFLENGTHAVIIQTRMAHDGFGLVFPHRIRAQVNVGGHKFLNDGTEDISVHHRVDLIAKFELIQNDLHIR